MPDFPNSSPIVTAVVDITVDQITDNTLHTMRVDLAYVAPLVTPFTTDNGIVINGTSVTATQTISVTLDNLIAWGRSIAPQIQQLQAKIADLQAQGTIVTALVPQVRTAVQNAINLLQNPPVQKP